MNSNPNMHNGSLEALLRTRWNDFAATPYGDAIAAVLTILMMFGVMFGCASAAILGAQGLHLLFHLH
jgi:hypothetical protein